MNNLQKNALYSLVLVIVMVSVYYCRQSQNGQVSEAGSLVEVEGTTMGVVQYHIKYLDEHNRDFKAEIDTLLADFNQSLSTYIPDSEISRFNQGDSVLSFESDFFYPVLQKSQEVYQATNGAFDPTVGPLVRAWGFGEREITEIPSDETVDSLQKLIGFDQIQFDQKQVRKAQAQMRLDFSAIAKGYAVDRVAQLLTSKGIQNYLVEIGQEVVCKGKNARGETWVIGIVNPRYQDSGENPTQAAVQLEDRAIATSGNYENYYIKDGKKYAHTIDPKTGYPVEHALLSASVFAPDCMTADAYATAFMVMGTEKAKATAQKQTDLDVLLIYSDEAGKMQTFASEGIKKYMQ